MSPTGGPTGTNNPCLICNGTGVLAGEPCLRCMGTGLRGGAELHTFLTVFRNDVMDKLNDIKEKVDEIKTIVDGL